MSAYFVDPTGAGQVAFADGLVDLGFSSVLLSDAKQVLEGGRLLLAHGWHPVCASWAEEHPGKVVVLWHTGLSGSELLGEGEALADVLVRAQAGQVRLLGTEVRDVPVPGLQPLPALWSPSRMRALVPSPSPARAPGHVVAGLHGAYPSKAKNIVGNVWAAVSAGMHVHISASVYHAQTSDGELLRALLRGHPYTTHPIMSRRDVVALVAACEMLVHASHADTFAFAALEAVYAGTPALVSAACGISVLAPICPLVVVAPSTLTADLVGCVSARVVRPMDYSALDQEASRRRQGALEVFRSLGFDL